MYVFYFNGDVPTEVSLIMTAKLKTIALFGCSYSSLYRQSLPTAFNKAAEELNVNLVYINSLGKIGGKTLSTVTMSLISLNLLILISSTA